MRIVIEKFVSELSKYHRMLEKKAQATASNRSRTVTTEDDEIKIVAAKYSMKSNLRARYSRLLEALASLSDF